jgi:hypothetical protein
VIFTLALSKFISKELKRDFLDVRYKILTALAMKIAV